MGDLPHPGKPPPTISLLEPLPTQADAIYDMIGFPDFILDNKELDDVYDGVGGHPAHGEGVWSLLMPSPGGPHGGAMSLFGGPIWDRALTEPPWYRAHPGQGGVNHPGGPLTLLFLSSTRSQRTPSSRTCSTSTTSLPK